MERKKEKITGINKSRKSIVSYTTQLIIVVYHTKFQTSGLQTWMKNLAYIESERKSKFKKTK